MITSQHCAHTISVVRGLEGHVPSDKILEGWEVYQYKIQTGIDNCTDAGLLSGNTKQKWSGFLICCATKQYKAVLEFWVKLVRKNVNYSMKHYPKYYRFTTRPILLKSWPKNVQFEKDGWKSHHWRCTEFSMESRNRGIQNRAFRILGA